MAVALRVCRCAELISGLLAWIKSPFERNTYVIEHLFHVESHFVKVEFHDTDKAFKGVYLDLYQLVLYRLAMM
jgi:hypothetical protein